MVDIAKVVLRSSSFGYHMGDTDTVIIQKIVRLCFSTLVSLVRLHLGGDYVSGATKFIKIGQCIAPSIFKID